MISANDLRKVQLTEAAQGYSVEEVDSVLNEAADTIDAQVNENKSLYHKLEVLAAKIEEYREEEDSIKSALITAQKVADKMTRESNEAANKLLAESKAAADAEVSDAHIKAEKIVSEAREFAATIIKNKTDEANAIVEDAEKKSNDAINSAKIVAQNILDQAKEISDDLVKKSKEENEAYELLNASLRRNAAVFIDRLKTLYGDQLESLNGAKLFSTDDAAEAMELASIQNEKESLVSEIGEMENAIPEEITLEKREVEAPDEEVEAPSPAQAIFEEVAAAPAQPVVSEAPAEETPAEEAPAEAPQEEEIISLEEEAPAAEAYDVIEEVVSQEEEEVTDPMEAVAAFSANELTPIDNSKKLVPEIEEEPEMEEKSLFDEKLPFENYFNLKKDDAHLDKTQTISLIPPDDDEEDDEPKFKGFFRKKR